MTERQGTEIDYCPGCRGVWLDRGELDKIAARNSAASISAPPSPWARQALRDEADPHGHPHPYRRHKRRKGVLEQLFD